MHNAHCTTIAIDNNSLSFDYVNMARMAPLLIFFVILFRSTIVRLLLLVLFQSFCYIYLSPQPAICKIFLKLIRSKKSNFNFARRNSVDGNLEHEIAFFLPPPLSRSAHSLPLFSLSLCVFQYNFSMLFASTFDKLLTFMHVEQTTTDKFALKTHANMFYSTCSTVR